MPNLSDDMQQAKSGNRDGNHLGRGHHTGSFCVGCTHLAAPAVPRIALKHLIILSFESPDRRLPRATARTRFWSPRHARGRLRHADLKVVTVRWRPMLIVRSRRGPIAADDRLSMERPAVDVKLPWMTLRPGRPVARTGLAPDLVPLPKGITPGQVVAAGSAP
jgi:hypothetical protein